MRSQNETIIHMHTYLSKELRELKKRRPAAVHMGFGAYDDAEEQKLELEHARSLASSNAYESALQNTWQEIVRFFGRPAVEFALQEAQRRIGDLPYVE